MHVHVTAVGIATGTHKAEGTALRLVAAAQFCKVATAPARLFNSTAAPHLEPRDLCHTGGVVPLREVKSVQLALVLGCSGRQVGEVGHVCHHDAPPVPLLPGGRCERGAGTQRGLRESNQAGYREKVGCGEVACVRPAMQSTPTTPLGYYNLQARQGVSTASTGSACTYLPAPAGPSNFQPAAPRRTLDAQQSLALGGHMRPQLLRLAHQLMLPPVGMAPGAKCRKVGQEERDHVAAGVFRCLHSSSCAYTVPTHAKVLPAQRTSRRPGIRGSSLREGAGYGEQHNVATCMSREVCQCSQLVLCANQPRHSQAALQCPHCGNRCPASGRFPQSAGGRG